MANLPTLKVLLDNGTGTFPFDISSYALGDGYTISRGRDDWQAAVTAGQLDLTLNNSDGRFTPGSTLIASPSPIVVDQRIRVQEIVNGVTYTRFTGFVKSWPVEWPATVPTFARVRLSATDAQARAERRPLRSATIEEVMFDSPRAYYTLDEAAGSVSAGDTSGNGMPSLALAGTGTAMTFGSGIGPTDGLSSATFAGGTFLRNTVPASFISASSAWSIECFFTTTATPATSAPIVLLDGGTPGEFCMIAITSTGKLNGSFFPVGSVTSAASVNDGLVHHAMVTLTSGGLLTLYLDGVSAGTAAGVALFTAPTTRVNIAPSDFVGVFTPYVGTVSHADCYNTALAAGRAASHAAARNNFVGETGVARATRIAAYAGITAGTMDSSLTNMAASSTADSTTWSEVQAAVDAEFGVAYIDGTGALTFHNRNRVVSKTAPDLTLTNMALTTDVVAVVDDQNIVNYIEVTAEGTGGLSLARSTTSEASHGRYPGSRSYSVQTDAEALDRANWLVSTLAEPTPRYGTLTINLYGMTPAQASTVLTALDVDCWLRVQLMSPQNPGGTTADVIVQGWQATATAESWQISCNVVARSLFAPVWIFGTSLFGTTTRFYV